MAEIYLVKVLILTYFPFIGTRGDQYLTVEVTRNCFRYVTQPGYNVILSS
jgi:hypothetical protein